MNSNKNFTQMLSFPILLHFLPFLMISITLCPLLSSRACHEEERRALLNFKSSLDDPSNRLSSWQESVQHRNCCHWHGIKCSAESLHVVSINLRNTKLENYINGYSTRDYFHPPSTSLRGKLSPSLVSINHLEYLDLAFNDFHRQEPEIPFRFSELTKLTHLDLSYTNFSASISTPFSNVSSLVYLDLSCPPKILSFQPFSYLFHPSCLESSSTKWMRRLVNLQELKLSGMDLFEATSSKLKFSEDISYLQNLRDLDISDCNISGPVFPIHQFYNLSLLSTLKMNDNRDLDSSIPLQLANLTSLSILDLSVCEFQGSLPSSIYHLSRLQHLDLSDNNITSSIHSSISNLKYLHYLDLLFNNIHGFIPKSICQMVSLRHLNLGHNNVTGTIPICITKLRSLSVFEVYGNSIGGTVSLIPLINELNLTYLDLGLNNLTVVIDQHLYPSKFILEGLMLGSCNMGGFIPTFISNLTDLRELDLSNNNFTGAIPSFICNCSHLNVLLLGNNNFTGGIPSCISKLKNLIDLDLSNSKLRGPLTLPPQDILYFDLSHNKLYGEISIEAGERLSRASLVILNNNEISGSIPSSICSQEAGKQETIDFSHNKLSGIIPSSLRYCRSLFELNLANNNLTGNFPDDLPENSLYHLQLNNNNLSGTFPKSILSLSTLAVLNLGNNNFEGIIPTGLGSLNLLAFISLRSNKFNGSIPEDITQSHELHLLDLSMNNLSGSIPIKIGNLMMLKSSSSRNFKWEVEYQSVIKGRNVQLEFLNDFRYGIDLSCNILDGSIPDEIGLLNGLVMLNLSYNHFSNSIPDSIGNISSLDSLDLCFNRLSGHIPLSLASIDTLGYLDLSHNNLSGRIPRGNHFDTLSLNGSAFAGNDLLCGFPLKKDCEGDHNIDAGDTTSHSSKVVEDFQDAKEKFLLYAIVAMGCAVGFWGLFCVLLLKKQKWWFPYWRIVDSFAVKIVQGCIRKKRVSSK